MVFARKVWKLLVGIKDGLVLLFMLLFFMALYAALTARPTAGIVHDGALLIDLDGAIVEEPSVVDPIDMLLASEAPVREYSARDLVRALRAAASDERVEAVVLDLSGFTGGGQVHIQAVGEALDAVRKAKKPVLAYALGYEDDGVQLAAHASEIWVDPMGGALVLGPGGNTLYYAGLLDKLKVTANVYRVGAFKSAVEPYTRSGQSDAARAAIEPVYADLWEAWQADVKAARPKADIARITTDPVGWLEASGGDAAMAAKDAGLVDRIGTRAQFGQRVAEIVGEGAGDEPGSFVHTDLSTWLAANKPHKPGKAIGVVTVAGDIVDGDAGPGMAGGDRIAGLLDDALDRDFAALVVRVDSRGGSVMASERIREAIARYTENDIPVVVSMANVAASGGYWVATPASRIFAEPATLTGSIGVFAVIPTFERTLADLGVNGDGVKTTPLSGQPDLLNGFTPEVSAMLQANVENTYGKFLGLVGKARGKSPEKIDAVAQGRVWSGGAARQLGLVDAFGGMDEALEEAARLAKLDEGDWHPEYLGTSPAPFAGLLGQLMAEEQRETSAVGMDLAAIAARRQQALLGRIVAEVDRIGGTQGVQAYCLECGSQSVRTAHGNTNFLGLLVRLSGIAAD
jgi:protease-4